MQIETWQPFTLKEGGWEYNFKYIEQYFFTYFFGMQSSNKGSPYNRGFQKLPESNDCKETHIGWLHYKKLAESVLFYVLKIAFPASLLSSFSTAVNCA